MRGKRRKLQPGPDQRRQRGSNEGTGLWGMALGSSRESLWLDSAIFNLVCYSSRIAGLSLGLSVHSLDLFESLPNVLGEMHG